MTAADPLAARRNQIPRGILYMVLSTVMFAGVNAIIKWEVAVASGLYILWRETVRLKRRRAPSHPARLRPPGGSIG
jgi:hypothetical protein